MASSELQKQLLRHFKRFAPTIGVEGLRQSRRIEGQFSSGTETRGFDRIYILAQEGAGAHLDVVRQVIDTVSRFHRDNRRGTCAVFLRSFGPAGTSESTLHKLRERGIEYVVAALCEQAGDAAPKKSSVISTPGSARKKDLLLVLCTNHDIAVEGQAAEAMGRGSARNVLWVYLDSGRFEVGHAPPQN